MESLLYTLLNCQIREYPFSHIYCENVFSDSLYLDLLKHLPPRSCYEAISDVGNVGYGDFPERFLFDLTTEGLQKLPSASQEFWQKIVQYFLTYEFRSWLMGKFVDTLEEQYDVMPSENSVFSTLSLIKDFNGYSISPHTDSYTKVLTIIFYLPEDTTLNHAGTDLYVPLNPIFQDSYGTHLPREGFKKVYSLPFKPNSAFIFPRTNTSFHGVDSFQSSEKTRNTLVYTLKLKPSYIENKDFKEDSTIIFTSTTKPREKL
jgi:hypothetical protein